MTRMTQDVRLVGMAGHDAENQKGKSLNFLAASLNTKKSHLIVLLTCDKDF